MICNACSDGTAAWGSLAIPRSRCCVAERILLPPLPVRRGATERQLRAQMRISQRAGPSRALRAPAAGSVLAGALWRREGRTPLAFPVLGGAQGQAFNLEI
jgi:hypothetical protein